MNKLAKQGILRGAGIVIEVSKLTSLSIIPCWAAPRGPASLGPVSKPKKEPGDSDRDVSGLLDGGLTRLKQGPGATPHRVQQTASRTWRHSFHHGAGGGGGRLPFIGGTAITWVHQLPGKPAAWARPSRPSG